MSGCFIQPSGVSSQGNADQLKTNEFFFSGYKWVKKEYVTNRYGPGPNYFSARTNDIWVDSSGYLHMKISFRDGKWFSTEVISDLSFGYGTYVFNLGSRGDTLDREITIGLFTWDDHYDGAQINHYREIDFEFSRWELTSNSNFQFVVQPYNYTSSNMRRFNIDNTTNSNTVHAFFWDTGSIAFSSAYGSGYPAAPSELIDQWTYYGPCNPSPGQEKVHINLWLINGNPPSNGMETEIVIKSFVFIPR